MPVLTLAEMTWPQVEEAACGHPLTLLPVGALEAHGPHLPLWTDVIIAEAMARAAARRLSDRGRTVVVAPPVWTTVAGFAADFPGTVDVPAAGAASVLRGCVASLARHGLGTVVLANAHLDPGHLRVLQGLADEPPAGARVVFVNLARRRFAQQLTEEFQTGACHAGQFEGSIVLAERPDLYRDDEARGLPPVPVSLSDAIHAGQRSFREAGGEAAYFGWPHQATAAEGRQTLETLGRILADAVEGVDRASGADRG